MSKILVYGTLRQGHGAHSKLAGTEYLGETRLPGYDMYNLGGFPGIVPNPQNKEGVVVEIIDGLTPDVIEQLDHYEGYNPNGPDARNYYVRREVEVGGDKVEVYVFNKLADYNWVVPIPTGDWNDR